MNKRVFVITFLLFTASVSFCFAGRNAEEEARESKFVSINFGSDRVLPYEVALEVLSFCALEDVLHTAQLSKGWKRASDSPSLWRFFGRKFKEDYPPEPWADDAIKKTVRTHYLRIRVNTLSTPQDIKNLISQFPCLLTNARVQYAPILDGLIVSNLGPENIEFWIARGNEQIMDQELIKQNFTPYYVTALKRNEILIGLGNKVAIERKIYGLLYGTYCYERNYPAARSFSETLTAQDNREGFKGIYDFKKLISKLDWRLADHEERDNWAARKLNEVLVNQDNEEAMNSKIEEILIYHLIHNDAVKLNEVLINRGNKVAIDRKIKGLIGEGFSYKKDSGAPGTSHETLRTQGNKETTGEKVRELSKKSYSYKKVFNQKVDKLLSRWNIRAARLRRNETLVRQGDEEAMSRKVYGLLYGWYGYAKDLVAAIEFNEVLVSQGNKGAINRKIDGLLNGQYYGYKQDLKAAVTFNETLVAQGDIEAIVRKIEGLMYWWMGHWKYGYDRGHPLYGYQSNPYLIPPVIENLIINNVRLGYALKAFGLKYGLLGFRRDEAAANVYICHHQIAY